MFLTQRLLRFRNEHVDLFRQGNYFPIKASGTFADCCIGFARELEGQWIVVAAPRLSSRIGFPPTGERWKDTVIDLPGNFWLENARELFTGRDIPPQDRQLKLADALKAGVPLTAGGLAIRIAEPDDLLAAPKQTVA